MPEIKIKRTKKDDFELLLAELIESGMDVGLENSQSEIRIWLDNDSCISLILTSDGKWRME